MNPNSNIYGCASCRIWVKSSSTSPIMKLSQLMILEASSTRKEFYDKFPLQYKQTISITPFNNGVEIKLLNLHRHLIIPSIPPNHSLQGPFDPVDDKSIAYLCSECFIQINNKIILIVLFF